MTEYKVNGLLLLGEYGSVAQGTATSKSDHDYMGIVVEKQTQILGLDNYDTQRHSDAKQGEKSKPGESDVTYHGLRKFAKLAANGNPTVGSILYLPQYTILSELGQQLLDARDAFWSLKGGSAYYGYLISQIRQMTAAKTKRPEVVEEFGYDIKFAYHAYRLGVQGSHYMMDGDPQIPLQGYELDIAKAIRGGAFTFDGVMTILNETEIRLKTAIEYSRAPAKPDYDRINAVLVSIYEQTWKHGIF